MRATRSPPAVHLCIDARADLAESPVWDERTHTLYWVDINSGTVHRFNPANGGDRTWAVGEPVGFVALCDDKGLVLGTSSGIYQTHAFGNGLQLLCAPEQNRRDNRCNDGKCDPCGRIWAGTMATDETRGAGSLYLVGHDGNAQRMLENLTIPNGLAWSADGRTMYFIDSTTRSVMRYGFDTSTGALSRPRVAIRTPASMGLPDGMTIDDQDHLWIAHWGGACVACWDPDNGQQLAQIDLPAPHVSSCVFGGENFAELYITTARESLDPQALQRFPLSGGVFVVRPGARGRPGHRFRRV